MFGGFTGFNQNKGEDWGENLLNSVASKTIRHLFTACEEIDVKVRCQPSSKILQGTIDSFKMSGKGLVIRREFRATEMSFETDAVSLDFASVLQGNIALKQPTQAIAQVKLSESDINQSFKADLVRKRLENLNIEALTQISGGEPVSFLDVKLQLLPNNGLKLFAKAVWSEKSVPIIMISTLAVAKRRKVLFKDIQFELEAIPPDVREISQQLTENLAEILNNMVDLDRFNLDGVTMRINRLETQGANLLFSGYAQIERVPKTGASSNRK
ncbi:MAG: DUF2993 domain-containing protein [Cyanobacteria bacterium J083]|nr:MAG: DUF2993 domain-containing protein [Cyanobacteria bacterium J083]